MKNFRMPKDSAEDPLIPELLIRFNHRGLPQGKNIYKRITSLPLSLEYQRQ